MDNPSDLFTRKTLQEEPGVAWKQTEQSQSVVNTNTPETKTIDNRVMDNELVDQVGQLTRALHNSLRELGYDERLEKITAEVPEAQDKLTYVAAKTEQAAERVLNATEMAMPIQDRLSSEAMNLSQQWKEALEAQQNTPVDTEKFRNLLIQTLAYLDEVPKQANATNSYLMEIIMAQDFQDLTGQVIKKVTRMVQDLEVELLQLLVKNKKATENKKNDASEGLVNGPVINPDKRSDVVSNQNQVDDLLASLGF
ncbi:MAG: protein phosphatase CheZ [Nitrosomonas sp.]|nr:MAG: protein phosphatase CheZ [Nitrosomonas sp.]